jgi:peptide chain release factor 2
LKSCGTIFDVDERKGKIEEREQTSLQPNFWSNPTEAEKILKAIKSDKFWVDLYESAETAVDDAETLLEFQKEGESTEAEVNEQYREAETAISELELQSTLDQEEDELACVLEINSGAGGTESCDWVAMLYRMYKMWADKSGYKFKELNLQPDTIAGYRNVSVEISGSFAYGFLKGESGVHRLVRISPFNAQGKRQTTFASVFVYPLVDDTIEIEVNPSDVTMETFRASGAGGQHVNKTDSAVRLRHAPSGVVVECQEERSQVLNREKAMQMLKSRLYEIEVQKRNEERDKQEATKQKVEWGSQIRNYVLHPYKMVKDVRSNHETSQAQKVLDGDLGEFLKAFLLVSKN